LLNLVVNARDAMPDGGTITIAGQEQTIGSDHISGLAPGRYVCLSVSDTGHGMDEATLARAMEPFFTTKGSARAQVWACRWCTGWPRSRAGAWS
jgi:signal transduction histidine kinase